MKRFLKIALVAFLCLSTLMPLCVTSFAADSDNVNVKKLTYTDGGSSLAIGDAIRDNGAFVSGTDISYGKTQGGNMYITKAWSSGAHGSADKKDVTYIDILADGKTEKGSIDAYDTALFDKSYVSVDFDMTTADSYPSYANGGEKGGMLVSLDVRYYVDSQLTESDIPLFSVKTADSLTGIYSPDGEELLAELEKPAMWSHFTVFYSPLTHDALLYLGGILILEIKDTIPDSALNEENGAFLEGLKLTVAENAQLDTACSVKIDNLTTAVYGNTYAGAFASLFKGSSYYKIDKNYYPGYVRKTITFTLDDGDLSRDQLFFSYTEPAGFKGVVNLISSNINSYNKQQYIDMYSDYEIGNHGKYHVFRLNESQRSQIVDAPFVEAAADTSKLYKSADNDKIYHIYVAGVSGWRLAMFVDDFKAAVVEGHEELEAIFERKIGYYALPNGLRDTDAGIPEYIESLGYYAVRKTGDLGSSTGFSLPDDYTRITYNATVDNLLDYARQYDNLPDDGKLKYFSFGLHAFDYNNKWHILEEFCNRYGYRSDSFWYATDREIYDYVNAVNGLIINGDKVTNNSDITLYVKVGDKNEVVAPNSTVKLETSVNLADVSNTVYAMNKESWNTCEHLYDEKEGKAPTCLESGYADYGVCKLCGHSTYQELSAKGHTVSDTWTVVTEAQCLKDGKQVKACVDCGLVMEEESIWKLGHSFVIQEGTAPTCTESGNEDYKRCSRCGYETIREEVPAIGHSFSEWQNDGDTHSRTCSVCGEKETEEHVFNNGSCICGEQQPAETKKGFFQIILDWFRSIGEWFKNLFGGKKD